MKFLPSSRRKFSRWVIICPQVNIIGGGVHDAIAFGEHDVEVFVEEVANVAGIEGGLGRHRIHPCKSF